MKHLFFIVSFLIVATVSYARKSEKQRNSNNFFFQIEGLKQTNHNAYPDFTEDYTSGMFNTKRGATNFQAKFAYEYRNKKNYTLTLDILAGLEKQNYTWQVHLADYNPQIYFPADSVYTDKYVKAIPYAGLSVYLGRDYNLIIRSKLRFQAKLGLSFAHFFAKDRDATYTLSYINAIDNSTKTAVFADTHVNYRPVSIFYTAYLGAAYPVNVSFFKELRLGVSFIHAFDFFRRDMDYISSANINIYRVNVPIYGSYTNANTYSDRFRNIALSLGLAF